MKKKMAICWFRRDLRLYDHAALYHALKENDTVLPLFIFDRHILDNLEDSSDRRVQFIHAALLEMQKTLIKNGSSLTVHYGFPVEVFEHLMDVFEVVHVYANHDYEPYGLERDEAIRASLKERGIGFSTFKDQVIFEKKEITKDDGTPYTVFTPYSNKWRTELNSSLLEAYPVEKYAGHFYKQPLQEIPTLDSMGFKSTEQYYPSKMVDEALIKQYSETRNFPGTAGTSKLSVHLRFGTISIRQLASRAKALNDTYLKELMWRDFYQMILWFFPRIGKGKAFRPAFDRIEWRNNENEFQRWCDGNTGYPMVDAGMREMNSTGFMHNRVRMVVASFLCKHLLIDWRWGEAYFAAKLLDFDFASNNGGWQWASGSGCDAVPYFRIFNPTLQAKKFDSKLRYLRKWIPELESMNYAMPVVEHEFARKRCIEVYSKAVKLPSFS